MTKVSLRRLSRITYSDGDRLSQIRESVGNGKHKFLTSVKKAALLATNCNLERPLVIINAS